MQIVIDIPIDTYNDLMKHGCNNPGSFDCDNILKAVAKGTPLSKGHGRLIDVNDLLNRIGLEDNDRNRADNVGEIITLEDFDFTPTIIEADEAEREEDYGRRNKIK